MGEVAKTEDAATEAVAVEGPDEAEALVKPSREVVNRLSPGARNTHQTPQIVAVTAITDTGRTRGTVLPP